MRHLRNHMLIRYVTHQFMLSSSTRLRIQVFGVPGGTQEFAVGSDGAFSGTCGYSEKCTVSTESLVCCLRPAFATLCGLTSGASECVDVVDQSQSRAWTRTLDLS